GYLADNLLKEARAELDDLDLPPGYEIAYTGEQEEQQDAGEFLGGALLMAVFLISIMLVTEFNSVVQPVIILFSVLLSLIGVFWSLIITNQPFGVIMTGIGIISLAGVVVNNAIVMIDYINKLRDRGYTRREAIITGGLVRFRPVMLTAITTIGGLLPIVAGISLDFVNLDIAVGGKSVEMWGPMAWAVTTGLLVATVLTLIVVPVLYSLLDEVGQVGKRFGRWIAGTGIVFGLLLAVPVVDAQQPPSAPSKKAEKTPPAERDEESGEEPDAEEDGEPAEEFDEEADAREAGEDDAPDSDQSRGLRPTDELERDEMIEGDRTLALDEARRLAREQNLQVRQAEQQVEVARAQIRSAYAMILPRVTAGGNYTINQEEVTAEFDVGDLPIPEDQEPDPFVTQPKTQWSWEVGATIPLTARAYPGLKLAYGQREQAEAESRAASEQVDFSTVQLYYNLLLARQMVDISRQQLASAETMLRATERRIDAGQATEFERNRARTRVVEAERDVEQARQSYVKTRQSLAQMLQTEADFTVERPDEPTSPASLGELKDVADEERYIVEADRINEEIATLSRQEVFYRYLPTLSTTFQYFDRADTDLNEQGPQWQIIFGADWTLWDGGEREALLDERRAQLISAELQTRQTLSELDTDLEHAWADYRSAQETVKSSREQLELAKQSLHQAERGYENGVTTQLDLIDAQDGLTTARMQFAGDQLELEMAIRELRYLAGVD
ncbi:MAG: efflux RND transporter permease subunit, partial [Persicimonas sp.]